LAQETAPQSKRREFASGITRDFGILCGEWIIAILVLATIASQVERFWPGKGIIFLVPVGLIILYLAYVLYSITGKTVILTPAEITYKDRDGMVVLRFNEITDFHPPTGNKSRFLKAYMGDGKKSVSIDSLSFAKFTVIMSVVKLAIKQRQSAGGEDTYYLGGRRSARMVQEDAEIRAHLTRK